MDKSALAKLLINLNSYKIVAGEDLEIVFAKKYSEALEVLQCSDDDILTNFNSLIVENNDSYEWKYICLNFHILNLLNVKLSESNTEVLSVQETKNIKTALENLMLHGLLKNLQASLPHRINFPNTQRDILHHYNLLKCTTIGYYNCVKYPNLRMLILPHFLQGIIAGVVQIAFCPLKKPNTSSKDFIMTEEIYSELIKDQEMFKSILENMCHNIHPSIFIKEIMVLLQASAPVWFKKAISNTLTKIIRSKKGVHNIALAMLDGSDDDSTKSWKVLEVLTKLILSCRKFPDFHSNICQQVLSLLDLVKTSERELLIFERLFVSCTKSLYYENKELSKEVFIDRITILLQHFAFKQHKFREEDDITDDIKQTVRLVHACFVDNVNSGRLESSSLRKFINILFHFYHLTVKTKFETTNKELKEILIRYFLECCNSEMDQLLDNFLFGFTVSDVSQIRDDVIIEINEKILVKNSPHSIIYATADIFDTVYNLLNTEQKIILFGYLLKCITEKEKYFLKAHNSTELLSNEHHATSTVLERLIIIHKFLSQLSENKDVQCALKNKPDDIIDYIMKVLSSESTAAQVIFLTVMILDNLLSNTTCVVKYKVLTRPLLEISLKTSDSELKSLCNKILTTLQEGNFESFEPEKPSTDFEKALEDVYDPLLPTRGHGLLTLSKLIEKKDKHALERKQYLLNLFQLYLKDEDSFIYLNAVQGLAALADVFPDTILQILCEEYADFSKKGDCAQETRMKLGEVLVRVVKLLGDMAPKYKALLLNTLLSGIKDDDHLIRASSLSNLSEVCRVLNYKLGTIITEVLVCVHAIIATDKAIEARRAAVTVIRQLFVGLQSEMIAFLKEDILPIYRTLKEIYYNDKDDIMRLQAQLALEELNENMKAIIFPNQQLHLKKKIIMMD